jgi:hypothetical protein
MIKPILVWATFSAIFYGTCEYYRRKNVAALLEKSEPVWMNSETFQEPALELFPSPSNLFSSIPFYPPEFPFEAHYFSVLPYPIHLIIILVLFFIISIGISYLVKISLHFLWLGLYIYYFIIHKIWKIVPDFTFLTFIIILGFVTFMEPNYFLIITILTIIGCRVADVIFDPMEMMLYPSLKHNSHHDNPTESPRNQGVSANAGDMGVCNHEDEISGDHYYVKLKKPWEPRKNERQEGDFTIGCCYKYKTNNLYIIYPHLCCREKRDLTISPYRLAYCTKHRHFYCLDSIEIDVDTNFNAHIRGVAQLASHWKAGHPGKCFLIHKLRDIF